MLSFLWLLYKGLHLPVGMLIRDLPQPFIEIGSQLLLSELQSLIMLTALCLMAETEILPKEALSYRVRRNTREFFMTLFPELEVGFKYVSAPQVQRKNSKEFHD